MRYNPPPCSRRSPRIAVLAVQPYGQHRVGESHGLAALYMLWGMRWWHWPSCHGASATDAEQGWITNTQWCSGTSALWAVTTIQHHGNNAAPHPPALYPSEVKGDDCAVKAFDSVLRCRLSIRHYHACDGQQLSGSVAIVEGLTSSTSPLARGLRRLDTRVSARCDRFTRDRSGSSVGGADKVQRD